MPDIRLFLVADFLDSHLFGFVFTEEDGALRTTAQPFQICDVLKRDLPIICNN